jgi:predicted lipoprotein with Yx(FWY)xxD motif
VNRRLTALLLAAPITVLALGVEACGGGSGSTGAVGPPTTASGRPATVGVESTSLGAILANTRGRTVYLFKKDSGTTSACTGACATFWPPVRAAGGVTTGKGLTAGNVGTSHRPDGGTQVTFNGHPLYTYTGDHKPGDTNGQGLNAFGGAWFALSSAGNQVSGGASSSGPAGSSGSGY